MALIKCSECGKEVSSKAKSCPNCGNPINDDSNLSKKKVIIKSKMSLALRTSVTMDNLSVGEIGIGTKKEIELELSVGTHYIGVETNVKHGNNVLATGIPETVAVSTAKDGKQFTVDENDELIEIEILSKVSFQNSSGRCIVGEIKKYNKEEADKIAAEKQEMIRKEEERKQEKKEKQQKIENDIWSFLSKYKIPIIIGVVGIVVVLALIKFSIINKNNQEIREQVAGTYTGYIKDRKVYVRTFFKDNGDLIISYSRSYDSLNAGNYEKTLDDLEYTTERSSLDYVYFTFMKTNYSCYLSETTSSYSATKKLLKCRMIYGGGEFELSEK